jgi:anhydro-N-acetylmuramic acid kinase
MSKVMTVLGLMSGTSMDGIDAALIETDGISAGRRLATAFVPYADPVKTVLRACLGLSADPDGRVKAAEKLITDLHIQAVQAFQRQTEHIIDLVAFHGQTIFHDPAHGKTWQIGDGQRLANETGVNVMFDFRSADMRNGGQGAPLMPLYHRALAEKIKLDQPVCVLNLGGVGNITWINGDDIYACDTGPGNALLDDWMLKKTGAAMDRDGACAMRGTVDTARVREWLKHPYFSAPAPKSLDRNAFIECSVDDMSLEDGAATLTAFTVSSVLKALQLMPVKTRQMIAAGGGRHNAAIMQGLGNHVSVIKAEQIGWDGDHLEAEGFAWLAARSLNGQPTSLPTTTGCKKPTVGGRFVRSKA